MTLTTYAGLREAVGAWMNRADLTTRIPDFIAMVEAKLNRTLEDNVNMSALTTLRFTSNSKTPPDDLHSIKALSYSSGIGGRLQFIPIAQFDALPTQTGTPRLFTRKAGKIYIWPTPGSETVLNLSYRIKLDAANLGPNWLLEGNPDVYLFGALLEASSFMLEDERVPMWRERYETAISEINKESISNAYSGPLQLKSSGGE